MKVVQFQHPKQTYPDIIEATCEKLGKDWRLHSQVFLPGQMKGTGTLLIFFEKKPQFNVHEFKPRGHLT